METQLDIADLVAEFGAKYIDQGQTARDIKQQLFFADDISGFFRMQPETNSHYRSSFSSIDEVLQAFAIPFAPKSTVTFTPVEQKLGEFKIDSLVFPDKLWPSWLGFLNEIEKADRSNWSFIQWMITQKLIPKAAEDFYYETAYWGWQYTGINAAPTVDGSTFVRELADDTVALPANASMDGIKKQIAKFVDDGRTTPIVIGAWSTDPVTFCTQIEDMFFDGVESKLLKNLDYAFMNRILAKRYRDGRKAKYNLNYAQEADLSLINETNVRVQGTEAMDGSDQVWSTPALNRVKPTRTDLPSRFDVQKFDRSVKLLNNWRMQLTFDVPEFIVTSEHETTISAANIAAKYS